ncbi:DUF3422 domain-containing protein [Rhodobacteraceae bacterium 2376]|uniref:DUF3422 domain-containing protein n=1 Tax=Rhabdonatronobacter sediminivivens TaxID=2743469 RepID=A0A7Z0HXB0_9RHOB|nr:DUF3422 domain-containing protein [Rhabdonatronobacter sediminivivens]NYS23937.1 DUF3422 domain-containing protein [Rhabdonatronobacter sediminivivens]
MPPIPDHSLRYALVNELHARPFATIEAPCTAVYVAVKRPSEAAGRDKAEDRAHLLSLLARHGAAHPAPEATHHTADLGRHVLKWESHTEFVTYTAFEPGVGERPFDPRALEVFPDDWLAAAPGVRVTSVLLRVDYIPETEGRIAALLADWFVPESLAVSRVLDGAAIIASDFRIDRAGHIRMAVFVRRGTGGRRIGRIIQRLCEIETYKSMSMLGLARARELSPRMGALDERLNRMTRAMTQDEASAEDTLQALLEISSELENMLAESSFRFGATGAYEAIVHQRIDVLREERFEGRQTWREFMMRRYDPAMRTVKSAETRLAVMAERAMRAGTLLGTRVDVERSAQNQKLLESMDRRADLQLRLQHTVEGLSVVAISYYGVNLAANMAMPLAEPLGLSRTLVLFVLTPLVVAGVWAALRRIRNRISGPSG